MKSFLNLHKSLLLPTPANRLKVRLILKAFFFRFGRLQRNYRNATGKNINGRNLDPANFARILQIYDESYLCCERRSDFFLECYFEIFELLVWIQLIFRRLVNEIFSFRTNPGNETEEAFRGILIGRKYFCKSQ